MYLSVIIPVLDEEGNIGELYKRLVSTLESFRRSFEIIFSDDGSRDTTPEILKGIASSDSRVKVVRLRENFGQHQAILAGFEQSRGDIVVTLDGDLQNHPEDVPRLVEKIAQGYDVVAGWRRGRKDGFHRRLIGWVLSWLASRLTRVRLRDYGCMLRAYRRWVFEKVRLKGGNQIFIPTLVNTLGVRVAEVEVGHSLREKGRSKYGFLRLLGLYLDLISDFSLFPPQLISILRTLLSTFASRRILQEDQPPYQVREVFGGENRWKLCVFAYGELGYVGLEELIREGETIAALVTHPDDPEENLWFRSARELASENLIPVYEPEDVNSPQFARTLREMAPHLIFSFTFREILPREILEIPSQGCINLHPSLLPKYRGRCPANWVLINGEDRTGVTLHYMEERVDSGDIVGQGGVKIAPDDTIETLYAKLTEASVTLLRDTLPKLKSGAIDRIPQKEEEATWFGRRTPEDGRIDWRKSCEEIYNLVRAVTHPYPGAFFYHEGEKVFCWRARLPTRGGRGKPGEVLRVKKGEGILVSCSKGALLLESVQVEGEQETEADELAQRLRIDRGAILT